MISFKFAYKPKNELEAGGRDKIPVQQDENEPERECPNCHRRIFESELWDNAYVCRCGHHFRVNARQRIALISDAGTFEELFSNVKSSDPLDFSGYGRKLESAKNVSREDEAVICGRAKIGGAECMLFAMNPEFMMGSMGCAVGERITRAFETATAEKLPVVGCTISGGARMQEGLFSLMQMAKTSGAVKLHSDAGLFYLVLLTDPTMGGVTASFAMGGDIILAEPSATVGFAGARVIEQTTHKTLPKGFQKSEFLLEHGFVDAIVSRGEEKDVISHLLKLHGARAAVDEKLSEVSE
ncbi:MAG: acetyl-CoA carboxylase carboxyl transferase subunit beta [Firmicutes bacterium]|nr:acetyl-CoA carboxylase carboxyl transferase subunit beta [Bacillota bacterium]